MNITDFMFGVYTLGVIIPAFAVGFVIEWFMNRKDH